MRESPALFKKPWIAASGAPTRGPFSSLRLGLRRRQADDVQREPPRRRKALRALVGKARVDQGVGGEPSKIFRRLALHARGDFFAEEFEEEVGHWGVPNRNSSVFPFSRAGEGGAKAG